LFIAKQKDVLAQGWKELFPQGKAAALKPSSAGKSMPVAQANGATNQSQGSSSSTDKSENDKDGFSTKRLPQVKKGDAVNCSDAQRVEKQTSPPKHVTDATLLSAMTGIARYVNDPAIKKVLRETDGLGTEATRAGIIELLFNREFLARKGKEIRATIVGRQLIASLPESMGYPDMTANWESQLEAICQREISYGHFMQPMTQGLQQLITDVGSVEFTGLQGMGKAPKKWGSKKGTKYAAKKRTYKKKSP
jgi:DNA topoisomerase-3